MLCKGCHKKFLKEDESGCADPSEYVEEYPENCYYGSTVKKSTCAVCKYGWTPSVSGKSCEEERVKGCKVYHPNDTNACLSCNNDQGFYAVESYLDGKDTHQYCQLNAMVVGLSALSAAMMSIFLTR